MIFIIYINKIKVSKNIKKKKILIKKSNFLLKKDGFYIKMTNFYKKIKKYLYYEICKKIYKIQSVQYYLFGLFFCYKIVFLDKISKIYSFLV